MIKGFVNRESELHYLQEEYDSNRSSLVILYGRRRIGKTTLIKEFIKNKQAVYFLATQESERENKKSLQHLIADKTGNPLLKNRSFWNGMKYFNCTAATPPKNGEYWSLMNSSTWERGIMHFLPYFRKYGMNIFPLQI
ncbi:MAG: ATP-binding protein [Desulfobacteraceae bacterium]